MSLQEIKDQLAKENGNQSWAQYKETWRGVLTEPMLDAIAASYAKQKCAELANSIEGQRKASYTIPEFD